jgi:hypothetical protein
MVPLLDRLNQALLRQGTQLALRLIPYFVLAHCRTQVSRVTHRPTSRVVSVLIVTCWVFALGLILWVVWIGTQPR